MKYKNVFKIALVFSVMVMMFAGVSCSKEENPSLDLAAAVDHVTTQAVEVKIKSYTSGDEVTLLKGTVTFGTIVGYFTGYTADRAQPRYQEIAGKTEEVTIPYVLNYILTFKLSDGSDLTFDYGYDKIWFTTKDMLYAGIVDTNMNEVLTQSFIEK